MAFEGFPVVIGWELTLACNLRCRHCGSSAGPARRKELTLKESLALCEQFPALLVQEVDFTGGEPLLCPHWAQLARRLGELGICVKMLTNGLALAPGMLKEMKEVGIAGVGVSLDGLEVTHDYIRGHLGLFRRVLAGIEAIQRAGLPVTVITTVNALNVEELPSLLELLKSIGIRQWQIQPIFPLGRGLDCPELRLAEQDYLKLGAFAREWRPKAAQMGVDIEPADSFGYFTAFDDRQPPWRGCPAGLFSCGITSDGRVKGCLSLPDDVVEGDLRQDDLWDIWFSSGSFVYTRGFRKEELGPSCHSCERAEQCRGGCSAMSYGTTGCFHNDPYCFYGIGRRRAAQFFVDPADNGAAAPRYGT